MSELTDKLKELLDEVKTKIHDLLDSSEVKNEEGDVKQQVTQVIDDAKTDAENLGKEVETDAEKDVSAVGTTATELTEQQQAQVADPTVDATNPHSVQNPVPAGTPQELNVDPDTQIVPEQAGQANPNPQHIQQ